MDDHFQKSLWLPQPLDIYGIPEVTVFGFPAVDHEAFAGTGMLVLRTGCSSVTLHLSRAHFIALSSMLLECVESLGGSHD